MKRIYLVTGTALAAAGVSGVLLPSPLFGLFAVDPVHNAVHLLTGLLTLVAATRGIAAMRTWGKALGAIYGALALAGATMGEVVSSVMAVNAADNALHVAIALVFLYVGLLAPPR